MHYLGFSAQRLGEVCSLASVLLWALFPFLVHPQLNPLPPLVTAALSTLLAVLPTAAAVALRHSWTQLWIRAAWLPVFYATVLIGVLFYALLFFAAKLTSPVNIALLGLLEVPFSFLLLARFQSERVSRVQALGSALMVGGAAALLLRTEVQVNPGDVLVVLACVLPPFGNYFTKQARKLVGSEIILLMRSVLGGMMLLSAALAIEGLPNQRNFLAALPFVLLAGLLPMGISKLLWTEAVHRLPIPKAVSSAALVPAITVVLSFLILNEPPTNVQLFALLPVSFGVVLVVQRPAPGSTEDLSLKAGTPREIGPDAK